MNDGKPSLPSAPSWFQPGVFLAGLLIGLVLLAWAGHRAAGWNSHPGFVRLHPRISPEGNYYPTLDELCSIVRAQHRPGKRLVIIGGNSVLNGVGQPADRLWTLELQRRLGDGFVVVNLAMRGALMMDGGAVVAEVLRDEFPDLIYVANGVPFTPFHPIGEIAYQYLQWDAYFRGLLLDYGPRNDALEWYLRHLGPWLPARRHWPTDSWQEQTLYRWDGVVARMHRARLAGEVGMDRVLKYRDLWNWIGFEHFFTVPSFYTPNLPGWTTPRGRLADEEQDYETLPLDSPHRFGAGKTEVELRIVRGFSTGKDGYYDSDGKGGWILKPGLKQEFAAMADKAVPPALRGRTLILLSQNSPFYRRLLTEEERRRDEQVFDDGVAFLRDCGFRALEYGRDFDVADYGDRTHLTVTGGRKLAAIVAREIETMAASGPKGIR